jgi:uncharacterized protein (DUF4213/DUF364 family)
LIGSINRGAALANLPHPYVYVRVKKGECVLSVIDDLLNSVRLDRLDTPVQDVLIGLHWTAVRSRRTGLAATHNDLPCCLAEDMPGAGDLHRHSAWELAALLHSSNPLQMSVGMAALNSLISPDETEGVELNARDLILERGRGKKIALIGHFHFTEALRQEAAQLWVMELQPMAGDLPATDAPVLLPQADVIGLTATTLLNGTFEALSRLFSPKAFVMMLGPTTPLNRTLFDYGVDVLAGTEVVDPVTLFHYIGQGSSLRQVPGIRRFTLVKDPALTN